MSRRNGIAAATPSPHAKAGAMRPSPEAAAAASLLWDKWKALCFWNLPIKPAFTKEGEFTLLISRLRKCGTMRAWYDAREIESLLKTR